MTTIDIEKIDFAKGNGLVPTVIQDKTTHKVLMLGYMNKESIQVTLDTGKVTFFSRSKNRLWTKGETSGNFLLLDSIKIDCDQDTLLVTVDPIGPVCHTGADTCFMEENNQMFVRKLESVIHKRKNDPIEGSYTNKLFKKGVNKIAQKLGEEAVELIIEAKDSNDHLFLNEAADLMYHYLVLLANRGFKLEDVEKVLAERHK